MSSIQALRKTVARLRGPDGCPWDRAQTHQSLTECLVEECCELLDTIDREDIEHMREELGDVLIQVVMHAQLTEEAGKFDLEAVAAEANEKLIRRHPHVFGEKNAANPEEALGHWDAIKATEKNDSDGAGGLKQPPETLPSLLYAKKVFKEIEKRRIETNGLLDKERIKVLSAGLDEESAGTLLFELACACRKAGVDPEAALRRHAKGILSKLENGASG